MFSLTPEQQGIVRKNLALPGVTSFMATCIQQKNYSPDARAAYVKLLAQYGVTPESKEWQATSVDFYYQAVLAVARGRAVPTSVECEELEALKGFLGTSDEAAER